MAKKILVSLHNKLLTQTGYQLQQQQLSEILEERLQTPVDYSRNNPLKDTYKHLTFSGENYFINSESHKIQFCVFTTSHIFP